MTALLIDTHDAEPIALRRTALAGPGSYDEKWLQALLFRHPHLVPLDAMQSGSGGFIPLCREFTLPRGGGSVFLDLLGVTRSGRLVLIECKLWRNPQARREVIAQVLEYAALLRGWSYGDLTARLAATQGWRGENPLFAHARALAPDLDEVAFVEGVSASLASGDFQLVVAGDGIRSDLQAIAAHLNAPGVARARLSLLEVQLWSDVTGRTIVVPHIPVRTEVIEQRLIVLDQGQSVRLEAVSETTGSDDAPETVQDPDRDARRAANRAFWDLFIAQVRFDHPDQPPPRHGSNNCVRLALPEPAAGLTVYRTQRELGAFATFVGEAGETFFAALAEQAAALQQESGLAMRYTTEPGDAFKGRLTVAHVINVTEAWSKTEQLAWLQDVANRIVNLLRPRLAQWQVERLP